MGALSKAILLFSLNWLDAQLTILWVRLNVATEGNGFMARLLNHSEGSFLSVKLLIGALAASTASSTADSAAKAWRARPTNSRPSAVNATRRPRPRSRICASNCRSRARMPADRVDWVTAQALARNSDIFAAGVDMAGVHLWGTPIDVPLGHKDNVWLFDNIDTMTVMVPGAPRPGEIVVIVVLADGGRPRPRVDKNGAKPVASG